MDESQEEMLERLSRALESAKSVLKKAKEDMMDTLMADKKYTVLHEDIRELKAKQKVEVLRIQGEQPIVFDRYEMAKEGKKEALLEFGAALKAVMQAASTKEMTVNGKRYQVQEVLVSGQQSLF